MNIYSLHVYALKPIDLCTQNINWFPEQKNHLKHQEVSLLSMLHFQPSSS